MKRVSIAILCTAFAVALSACSQGTQTGTTATAPAANVNSWNGAPTGAAARSVLRKGERGFLPLDKWTVNKTSSSGEKSFTLVPAGPHRAAQFSLTGTGEATAQEVFSPAVAVVPGKTYTFSANVDASKVKSGITYLWISNVGRNRLLVSGQVAPGQNGRFGVAARIPEGVRKVRVGVYTGGCKIQKGASLTLSQPLIGKS